MYAPNLFQDKVALVTGGRSGIGYGIAELGGSRCSFILPRHLRAPPM